jgi:hypothetical protein
MPKTRTGKPTGEELLEDDLEPQRHDAAAKRKELERRKGKTVSRKPDGPTTFLALAGIAGVVYNGFVVRALAPDEIRNQMIWMTFSITAVIVATILHFATKRR